MTQRQAATGARPSVARIAEQKPNIASIKSKGRGVGAAKLEVKKNTAKVCFSSLTHFIQRQKYSKPGQKKHV